MAYFGEYPRWDITEMSVKEFLLGLKEGSVYVTFATSTPQLFLLKFDMLPWSLLVALAPKDFALCGAGLNLSIWNGIRDWGGKVIQIEENYKAFCKEISSAGLKKGNLPIYLFSNVAAFSIYLGKKSLVFGRDGYCDEWSVVRGYVVPDESRKSVANIFQRYLADFPTRSFLSLTGGPLSSTLSYDNVPISYGLGRWAMSIHSLEKNSTLDAIHQTGASANFASQEEFNGAVVDWLEEAVHIALTDKNCNLPLSHLDVISPCPNLRNGSFRGAPWLTLKSDLEYKVFVLRAKLIAAMKFPLYFKDANEHYEKLRPLDDPRIQEICDHLRPYLDEMTSIAPYLSESFLLESH